METPGKINRLLIANRGEIAVRVSRAARTLGIETIGIYSDPDSSSLHTTQCDTAVRLTTGNPRAGYLDMDQIVSIAQEHNCDAVHPGYGFLSENPEFVEKCEAGGLLFVGPTADTIRAMGSKIAARALMEGSGVPVIPGATLTENDLPTKEIAEQIGFPLLVKASAGGGGKGMRRVESSKELKASLEAAKREAQASFGDSTVYLEKLVVPARHIEVQVFGDQAGNICHLGDRDCSTQRRYQKVVEEAPAPGLKPEIRQKLHEAALQAAQAVSYVGAGTIEFVMGSDQRFYFLEMNTRLQVEHPVTEEVYGVDLVQAQLRVAMGESLEEIFPETNANGAAVECRIYAEDPSKNYLPSPGPLLSFSLPSGPGIRVETGVRSGDTISSDFDPMIAKVIAWGPDRPTALARMRVALDETVILGTRTNIQFLKSVVTHPDFDQASIDTGFLGREFANWCPSLEGPGDEALALIAIHEALSSRPVWGDTNGVQGDLYSPWLPGATKLFHRRKSR